MIYPEKTYVELMISDPWDWGTELGCGPFVAKIEKWTINHATDSKVLVSLNKPQIYKGVNCVYFIASARNENDSVEDILHQKKCFVVLYISQSHKRNH